MVGLKDSCADCKSLEARHAGGHVVAILPRGEAIRNFVYSGALDEVAAESQLSILSVSPNEEIWSALSNRFQRVMELRGAPEKPIVRIQRELLDIAHGRFLWSAASRDRWMRRDIEADTPARKVKRALMKCAALPFANRRGVQALSRLERLSSYLCRTTDEYMRLFRRLNPTLVFNASHVHSANSIQAVEAAQWLGIPTAAFIFSWDNLTSQGRINPPYDYYLVWNRHLRDQLLTIYDAVRPEQVFVTGTPQFDFHFRVGVQWSRKEFCRRVGADSTRPIVFYSTGMANHMPGEPEVVEGIARVLRGMKSFGPPQLLVRIYPKDRSGRFDAMKQANPDVLFPEIPWEPHWLTPREEDCALLTNMLCHADVGINIASTVSLELCMFDKPVLNVSYSPSGVHMREIDRYSIFYGFDHYRPVVESGALELVEVESEMGPAIARALSSPASRRRERRLLLEEMFGDYLDGRSAQRVAEQLNRLAQTGAAR